MACLTSPPFFKSVLKPFINSVIDEDSKSQRVGIVSAYFKSNEQNRNELENMKKVHEEYMKRLTDKYERDKSEKDGSGDKKESRKTKGKNMFKDLCTYLFVRDLLLL